jgi:hypothetical protein
MSSLIISTSAVVLAFKGSFLLNKAKTKEEIQTALMYSMSSGVLIGIGLLYF